MLTNDEIKAVFNGLTEFRQWACTEPQLKFARAIIAAHTAKIRQGVELPEDLEQEIYQRSREFINRDVEDAIHDIAMQYGDARDQAGYLRGLEDAKRVCEAEHGACWHANAIAASMAAQRCATAIEKLKGGE